MFDNRWCHYDDHPSWATVGLHVTRCFRLTTAKIQRQLLHLHDNHSVNNFWWESAVLLQSFEYVVGLHEDIEGLIHFWFVTEVWKPYSPTARFFTNCIWNTYKFSYRTYVACLVHSIRRSLCMRMFRLLVLRAKRCLLRRSIQTNLTTAIRDSCSILATDKRTYYY